MLTTMAPSIAVITTTLLIFTSLPTRSSALSFISPPSSKTYSVSRCFGGCNNHVLSSSPIILSMSTATTTEEETVTNLKSTILTSIAPTKRGLSATPTQKSTIETQIQRLESSCPLSEPARDKRMGGKWKVEYTTAPPPSNGQLGPFVGIARQVIDLDTKRYANLLIVDPNEWLSATLDATWEEWDGIFLEKVGGFDGDNVTAAVVSSADNVVVDQDDKVKEEEKNDSPFDSILNLFRKNTDSTNDQTKSKEPDYGATSWKVIFDSLTIRLFGIPIVTKKFEDTARVWRMSYLDDDTRVVRAGQTGKSEDDVVFYMTRED